MVAFAGAGSWTLVQLGVVLLALAGLGVWLRRRVEGQAVGARGRSIRLTAEHAVFVVEVEGRRWLIGTGPGGPPALLDTLSPQESADAAEVTDPAIPCIIAPGTTPTPAASTVSHVASVLSGWARGG